MGGSLGLGLGFEEHNVASDAAAAIIDGSCFWIKTGTGASAELKPYEKGTVTDYNLIWDLDVSPGLNNYMPESSPATDCNWEKDGSNIMPIST
tara:strand:+ start:758 stop:1036 length:279 start_codon:yes stop_codon:yes gene_type:complete